MAWRGYAHETGIRNIPVTERDAKVINGVVRKQKILDECIKKESNRLTQAS